MSDVVRGALIAAVASVICQILINIDNRAKRKAEDAMKEKQRALEEAEKEKRIAVEEKAKEDRLEARFAFMERTLEEAIRKLDIHNGYAEKLGSIQQDIAYIKGKMEGENNG